jgi:hypothetical protein
MKLLGIDTSNLFFVDVLLIDPSYSEMIQDPAKAAILLIP